MCVNCSNLSSNVPYYLMESLHLKLYLGNHAKMFSYIFNFLLLSMIIMAQLFTAHILIQIVLTGLILLSGCNV